MNIVLDEKGFVLNYALIGGLVDEDVKEVDEPENIEDFEENYRSFYYQDGKLLKDAEEEVRIKDLEELEKLREMRERICFPIINRGALWYEKLTSEQKKELDIWYEAWLNVTETKVIPEMPSWLE
jgi:hypothetical protein